MCLSVQCWKQKIVKTVWPVHVKSSVLVFMQPSMRLGYYWNYFYTCAHVGPCYIQHCMDLQLAVSYIIYIISYIISVDPYKKRVLFESMDWLPKTHSQLTYFCKSNINQTFTNGGSMIWGVRIAILYRNQTSGRRIDHLFVFFGPQKLGILTARLLIQWEGISVLKYAQNLHSYCKNNSFWKTLW